LERSDAKILTTPTKKVSINTQLAYFPISVSVIEPIAKKDPVLQSPLLWHWQLSQGQQLLRNVPLMVS
jgi:hypothetical protein